MKTPILHSRITACLGLGSAVAAGLSPAATAAKAAPAERPNFIVILADDQGYNDLGCFGSALIRTPNLDQMAAEGIRLTNFYAQPVSGPSRTALLTGCYPIRVGEVGNQKRPHPMVHPNEWIIPEILRQRGYQSACIGKWDINGHQQTFPSPGLLPTRMGFDYWFGLPSSIDDGVERVYRNETILEQDYPVDTLTQLYTAEAIRFIEANRDRPFFLYLAHSMPHTRLGASSRFKGRSQAGLYGDAVEELDWSLGAIRDLLRRLHLSENTYIVYTSDNGPWSARGPQGGSAYPLRGEKASTWEGGPRVPCVVWSPALKKGGVVCDQVVTTMDLLPTFAALCGAPLPEGYRFDGQNIAALLRNPAQQLPEQPYYYYIDTHLQAVRLGDWKLVRPRPQAPPWVAFARRSVWIREDMDPVRDYELYNLREDPSERRDCSAEHPEVVGRLKTLLEQARNELGDYNQIGTQARFYDAASPRPEASVWQQREAEGWRPDTTLHPYYRDGGRIL